MRAAPGTYTAAQVARATGGKIRRGDPDAVFQGVSTDSRNIQPHDLFIPIRGEKFDGNDFLVPALEAGARGSLVDRDPIRDTLLYPTKPVLIQVQDTLQALADLASTHRHTFSPPLIAVTGSSGKTTVKEMIATVLGRSHRPLISPGNLNNTIGLPMTILNLCADHDCAVVEAGINMLDEMRLLAHACAPDVAIITNIGPVHLEGLGSMDTVAREKFRLVEGMKPGGTAVLPAREPLLTDPASRWGANVLSFGIEEGDCRVRRFEPGPSTFIEMETPWGVIEVTLPLPGRHNVTNVLAAAAACLSIGVHIDDIPAGLAGFTAPQWRMETLSRAGGGALIRDCYNANPQSMAAALEVLTNGSFAGKTMAVLADMMELGEQAATLHEELGSLAARLGVDRVVYVGTYGPSFARGFEDGGGASHGLSLSTDQEAAWRVIRDEAGEYGAILVKGSRAMAMEAIAERILKET